MFKDFLRSFWQNKPAIECTLLALIFAILFAGMIYAKIREADADADTVRQVVIVKGFTPLSLQTAVNQMLIDSSFVNVRLDYASLPRWDVVMISHDVQVDE